MKTADLQAAAEIAYLKTGRYSLSFWTLGGATALELALLVAIAIDRVGGVFRASTVGRMDQAGLTLQDHRSNGHAVLVIDGIPSPAQCDAMRSVFDDPIPNPYRR